MATTMLPHTKDRPLNLWRWNAGIDRQRIVQQEIPKGAPEWVRRVTVPRRKGGDVTHVLANDAATLRWLSNQNCITPHIWSSRADRLDRPDRIVFDLDPPEGTSFTRVREAALDLGDVLREVGLEPFAMTTGSRGIHVVAPLRRTADNERIRETARAMADELAGRCSDRLTTEWRIAKREGRILIDTARNTFAQTTVAPYAVRARPGAPVATPLAWEELDDEELRADSYTLATVPERLERRPDPWAGIARHARALPRL